MNKEIVEQQDNVVTTKDKYNRVIKRSIILCWIALAICFIVKIFGGNFFEIVVHNDRFTAVCELCQKSFILTNIVYYISSCICTFLYTNAVCATRCLSKKWNIILYTCMTAIFVIKIFLPITGFVLDLAVMWVAIPLLICRNIWRVLIGVALTLIFQVLSLITKNIGLGILGDNFLVSIIVMIDTYFMLALYYLYSLKLEVKKNG